MAATVLNGTTSGGSISWTNNTGGNVRLIVNYFGQPTPDVYSQTYGIQIAIGNVIYRSPFSIVVGKNLAFWSSGEVVSNTLVSNVPGGLGVYATAIPTELYITTATTLTLSRITGSGEYSYNLLLLPENG
jgi:hypothetical protein